MSIIVADQQDTFSVVEQSFSLAQKLAKTPFVPVALRNQPEAVMAAILTGREVGLQPMTSLSHIHVIEGRPSLDAFAARALIQSKGHEIWVEESTVTRAVLCGHRRGEDHVHKAVWTADDAKRAGLAGKQNWMRYPKQMLMARATGDLARLAFADVMGGLAYLREELEDGLQPDTPDETNGTASPTPPAPKNRRSTRARLRQEPRTAAPPAPAPEPPPEPDIAPPSEGPEPSTGQVNSAEQAATPPGPVPQTAGQIETPSGLTIAQSIAMTCREIGINRADLIRATTGKTSARDVTREEALEILNQARRIADGQARLIEIDGMPYVADVVDEPEFDMNQGDDQ